MSKTTLKFPKFATEAEEAQWWHDNRDMVADFFSGKYRLVPARDVQFTNFGDTATPVVTAKMAGAKAGGTKPKGRRAVAKRLRKKPNA